MILSSYSRTPMNNHICSSFKYVSNTISPNLKRERKSQKYPKRSQMHRGG
jgi:hypothetical protein